jgi:mRNA interferase RelE/StbE
MEYEVSYMPTAIRDLDALPRPVAARIVAKAGRLAHDLAGDVKRLTNHHPAYRLRVGDYRVLFEIEGSQVVVYRVKHRREAYDR